jgi:hypothetical protein
MSQMNGNTLPGYVKNKNLYNRKLKHCENPDPGGRVAG